MVTSFTLSPSTKPSRRDPSRSTERKLADIARRNARNTKRQLRSIWGA